MFSTRQHLYAILARWKVFLTEILSCAFPSEETFECNLKFSVDRIVLSAFEWQYYK